MNKTQVKTLTVLGVLGYPAEYFRQGHDGSVYVVTNRRLTAGTMTLCIMPDGSYHKPQADIRPHSSKR